jgi:hypothetical protein
LCSGGLLTMIKLKHLTHDASDGSIRPFLDGRGW